MFVDTILLASIQKEHIYTSVRISTVFYHVLRDPTVALYSKSDEI